LFDCIGYFFIQPIASIYLYKLYITFSVEFIGLKLYFCLSLFHILLFHYYRGHAYSTVAKSRHISVLALFLIKLFSQIV